MADPVFEHWIDKLNLESPNVGTARVMFNLCGHYELPFDTRSSEAVAHWVASLPKFSVIITNAQPKWKLLTTKLQDANSTESGGPRTSRSHWIKDLGGTVNGVHRWRMA